MGSACTKGEQVEDGAEEAVDDEINRRIARENKGEKHVRKILLLGAGESGKSTIFKQIKVLFQTGFDDYERRNYTSVVHANVFQAIKILLEGCEEFALEVEGANIYVLQPENEPRSDRISKLLTGSSPPTLTPAVAEDIQHLWKDPAVQAAYLRANSLQLPDCSLYFLENIHRLAQPDYVPTAEDVLYARVRTTGIVETEFTPTEASNRKVAPNEVYKMVDVGGQRNERRKWMHLFHGVTAVIFCAALSEYDQTLFEDEAVNRMMETKDLFEWVIKQPWFEKTSFMVFLNKLDIFERKVLHVPLTKCDWFKDYKPLTAGSSEVERKAEVDHAFEYVKNKFKDLYYQNSGQESSVHRVFEIYGTTALDRLVIKRTFSLVDKTLTRQTLVSAGLL